MCDHPIILQISFDWEIPTSMKIRFNESVRFSSESKELNYVLEDLEDEYIQVWKSTNDFMKTFQFRKEKFEGIRRLIYDNNNIKSIREYLEDNRVIPKPFPNGGLEMTFRLVRGDLPEDFSPETLIPFARLDPNISFITRETNVCYSLRFKSPESITRFMALFQHDFIANCLK